MIKELPIHCFNYGEPYQNYIELSKARGNLNIIDIGTYRGYSAFALAANKTNTVHTFDIANYVDVEFTDNIKQYDKGGNDIPTKLLKSADIILLDVDPHDGLKEPIILKRIIDSGFKGLLIIDDADLNEGMRDFYNSIELRKELVRWHHSGTGLVYFYE